MPLLKRKRAQSGSNTALSKSSEGDWTEVQMRVYTNWVNDKLKAVAAAAEGSESQQPITVGYLPRDLANGLVLIQLLEFLSGKKISGK